MFDIHEELPPLEEQPKIQEIKAAPSEDTAQPKTRYLIKTGGKQTFGEPANSHLPISGPGSLPIRCPSAARPRADLRPRGPPQARLSPPRRRSARTLR